MNDIILKITNNVIHNDFDFEGYTITTNNQTILILISNAQLCCEEFGINIELPNNINNEQDLIGTEIYSIGWEKEKKNNIKDLGFCQIKATARVHLVTSIGDVYIEAWNEHNGYYPHTIKVAWNNYEDEQEI